MSIVPSAPTSTPVTSTTTSTNIPTPTSTTTTSNTIAASSTLNSTSNTTNLDEKLLKPQQFSNLNVNDLLNSSYSNNTNATSTTNPVHFKFDDNEIFINRIIDNIRQQVSSSTAAILATRTTKNTTNC